MVNILLTGGTGFVGTPLRAILKKNNIPTRLVLRKPVELFKNETAIFCEDFFNADELFYKNALKNIQTVIHLAWYVEHGKYQYSNLNEQCKNASFKFAEIALKENIAHFIGVGTCFEYQMQNAPLDISTPLKPFTPYGKAKAELFLALKKLFQNTQTRFSWARLFYLFGENENPNRLTPSIHNALKNGEKITIKNGDCIRDFLNTKDAAKKIFDLTFSKPNKNNAYNICSGNAITLKEYAENIAKKYNRLDLLDFKNEKNQNEVDYIVGIPTEIKK